MCVTTSRTLKMTQCVDGKIRWWRKFEVISDDEELSDNLLVIMQKPKFIDYRVEETINGVLNELFVFNDFSVNSVTFINLDPSTEEKALYNENIENTLEKVEYIISEFNINIIIRAFGSAAYSRLFSKLTLSDGLLFYVTKDNRSENNVYPGVANKNFKIVPTDSEIFKK